MIGPSESPPPLKPFSGGAKRCGFRPLATVFAVAALLLATASCAPSRPPVSSRAVWAAADTRGLSFPAFNPDVVAQVDPPLGWAPEKLKASGNHVDQVWLSPTGDTAYGVIYFKMPLPVGQNLAFSGFITQMKKTQGEATVLSRDDDPTLPGIRFVAAGGRYVIRANLLVSGWEGWTVYAGTLKNGLILPNELDLAVRAREHTTIGRPENSGN